MDDNTQNGGGDAGARPLENGSGTGTGPTPGAAVTPGPTTTKKDEEMVQVPKNLLEQVLAGQKKMEESIAARDREIERLTYAADKNRLGIFDARNNGGQLIRKMKVGVWGIRNPQTQEVVSRHIVRGWKMVQDDVFIEDNGGVRRVIERQVVRLFLDDGVDSEGRDKEFKEIDMDYSRFYGGLERIEGEVVKEARDERGEYRTLRFDDGRQVEMDTRFVNP